MCMTIAARVPSQHRADLLAAAERASESGLDVRVAHPPRWSWARNSEAEAVVSEKGGCACSLLSDDADWGAASVSVAFVL